MLRLAHWRIAAGAAVIVAGIASVIFANADRTTAVTPGFTVYIDAVADGTAGNVQTSAALVAPATSKIEVEVQGVPGGGLAGYNIVLNWSPAGNMTATPASTQITDKSGFAQVAKSAGAGTATVSFSNLDDITCTDPAAGGAAEGLTSAVLFEVTFTGVVNGPTNLTINTTFSEVGMCDTSTSPPDNVDPASLTVSGAAAPTNTPAPATNTPVPATATNTPAPATATNTPLPGTATNTSVPAASTNTPVPATATNTPVPPTATNTPVATATNTPVPATNTPESNPVALIALDMDISQPGIQDEGTASAEASEVLIDVVIQNANAIGAFEFIVVFDVLALDFAGWTEGLFLGSTGRSTACEERITENTVRIGCSTIGPPPPEGASGDGVLATLAFVPKRAGRTCLSLQLVETAEIFGNPLPTEKQSGCITLVPATATPTATSTNTAVPPTSTHTNTATATNTPAAQTSTPTKVPSKTNTPVKSATKTKTPTKTPAHRDTPTRTPDPHGNTQASTATPKPNTDITVPASGNTPVIGVLPAGAVPPSQLPSTGEPTTISDPVVWIPTAFVLLTLGGLVLIGTAARVNRRPPRAS